MSEPKHPAGAEARRVFLKNVAVAGMATGLSGVVGDALAQADASPSGGTGAAWKPATRATLDINQQYANFLNFADAQDFEDATDVSRRSNIVVMPEAGLRAWLAGRIGARAALGDALFHVDAPALAGTTLATMLASAESSVADAR
ncbi:hypothetical protein [Caballeronia sp. AZ1_KS37]|uniref:hypothetical protein n=1 Tax=Caballeronia sp. AZ1_KS37 TaxID=2921756 RepID=UPI00202982D9|nr:hypothetical protein [Caballeronia sp. AZ1_KS37]